MTVPLTPAAAATPGTAAGRALLETLAGGEYRLTPEQVTDYKAAILAIEAEAEAAPASSALRAWEWRYYYDDYERGTVFIAAPERADAIIADGLELSAAEALIAAHNAALASPAGSEGALDGAAVVRMLHGVGNTLAGWVRHMDGYGDDALASAIDFVIQYPDPKKRIAAARRRDAERQGE